MSVPGETDFTTLLISIRSSTIWFASFDLRSSGVMLYYKDTLIAYGERKLKVPENIEGIFINVKSQSQTWLVAP